MSSIRGDFQSALQGYRTALELLPKVVWLGLDTPSHQDRLLNKKPEELGCLAVTCAIQLGNLKAAIELLDLGRSVFWQQAGSLRSDLELLRVEDQELATELQRVGHQLDANNFSNSLAITRDESDNRDERSAEDVGKERRRLVSLWEDLVEQVRQLPQFKRFLQPVPFDELRQASTEGQIIIVNASKYGVDALVFGVSQPIQHVPLPDIDLEMLIDLSEDIVHQRPAVPTKKSQQHNTLHSILFETNVTGSLE
jgi:hypothetical protein